MYCKSIFEMNIYDTHIGPQCDFIVEVPLRFCKFNHFNSQNFAEMEPNFLNPNVKRDTWMLFPLQSLFAKLDKNGP